MLFSVCIFSPNTGVGAFSHRKLATLASSRQTMVCTIEIKIKQVVSLSCHKTVKNSTKLSCTIVVPKQNFKFPRNTKKTSSGESHCHSGQLANSLVHVLLLCTSSFLVTSAYSRLGAYLLFLPTGAFIPDWALNQLNTVKRG